MNNNKRLITTASIALILFNVQPAKADTGNEFEEENKDIEQIEEKTINNNQEIEEKINDEPLITSEEVIEYITSLLDTNQSQAFNDLLSKKIRVQNY